MFIKTFPKRYFGFLTKPADKKLYIVDPFKINQIILKSRDINSLNTILINHKNDMNYVNLSTSFKKLLEFSKMTSPNLPDQTSFLSSLASQLITMTIKKLEQAKMDAENARAISNIFFYHNKLPSGSRKTELNSILIQFILKGVELMNEQEIANVIYTFAKLKSADELIKIEPKISEKIAKFSPRAISIIFYSYTCLAINLPELYKSIDTYILKFNPTTFTELDLVQLIISYSKIQNISSTKNFLSQINSNHGQVILDKLGILGISSILISFTKFSEPILSKEVYNRLERKILADKNNLNEWMLANILRGYDHFNFGSEEFFIELEAVCLQRCPFFNNQDFTTILHAYARNLYGSTLFYKTFDEQFVKNCSKEVNFNDEKKYEERSKRNYGNFYFLEEDEEFGSKRESVHKNENHLSTKHFCFLFYSFSHVRNIYNCSEKLKSFFKNYINNNLSEFSMEELGPIFAMNFPFFNEKGVPYENLARTLIDRAKNEKHFRIELKPLREMMKTFCTHTNLFKEEGEIAILFKNQFFQRVEETYSQLKTKEEVNERILLEKMNYIAYIVSEYSKIKKFNDIKDILHVWKDIKEAYAERCPDMARQLYSQDFVEKIDRSI